MEVISVSTLKSWLEDAETARHKLALGQLEVEVGQDGQGLVKYTPASLRTLDNYIADLKVRVRAASGEGCARRAHGVTF
ncbi:MAG: gpW family head-tail joining protein [Parvibaculaceae bacterium]|nr:gpW family head-tail joining protein [Parvibaculaceae bacterium]